MNLGHKHKATWTSLLLLTFICYQNFDLAQNWRPQFQSLSLESQKTHAENLWGSTSTHRLGLEFLTEAQLTHSLLIEVSRALPTGHQHWAHDVTQAIIEQSQKHDIDPFIIYSMIKTESRFNPHAKGLIGEIGLMQIRPETAVWIAPKFGLKYYGKDSLFNPVINIAFGVAYVAYLKKEFTSPRLKLAAYNMGPNNLRRLLKEKQNPNLYANKVLSNYLNLMNQIQVSSSRLPLQAAN